jgi:hypothetical protein
LLRLLLLRNGALSADPGARQEQSRLQLRLNAGKRSDPGSARWTMPENSGHSAEKKKARALSGLE